MRRVLNMLLVVGAVALIAAPTSARADGYVSPFIGANFAADSATGKSNFGVGAGYMGAGIAGGEFDFGYAPNFFGSAGNFGDNNVITAMGNLIVGIPVGGTRGSGVRPYGTVGFGMVRTQVDGAVGFPKIANKDLGFNVGAGVMGFFSDHAGIRGDVRYFRNLSDENSTNTVQFGGFHFWRASFGVVIR
jgi:Outer membrane protein beta-barrel domain